MKFHVISDLHLEHARYRPSALAQDADAVILAGDICAGTSAISWASEAFPGKPVIYVPGNHEYYGEDLRGWHTEAADLASRHPNVHICQANSVQFPNAGGKAPIRVLGTTLWTDFKLYGSDRQSLVAERVERALADYRAIWIDDKRLRWKDTLELHNVYRSWLAAESTLARERGETVIIVSHHGPSIKSSAPMYLNDLVTAGFASDLESFAAANADVWIHGHMHNSSDYMLGHCRVICNPRGYPRGHFAHGSEMKFENPSFNPDFILEVK